MAGVTYSKASLADLADIWEYVAQDSVFLADRLLRRFQAKLDYLAGPNRVGGPRPELAADCRSYPLGKYCIYYRPNPQGIELIRLLHSARDIRRIKFPG